MNSKYEVQKQNLAVQVKTPSLIPFWLYTVFFKWGAGLHYALLSFLGSQVLPLWLVGILVGGGAFVQLVLDVPAGFVLDRFGYIRMLRISVFIFILSIIPLFFGLSILTFILTLSLSTIAWLFFSPGTNAYILSMSSAEKAGKMIGFFHTMLAVGVVLASVVFTPVATFPILYIALSLTCILILALGAGVIATKEHQNVHAEKKVEHHSYYIRRTYLHHLLSEVRVLNPALLLLALHNMVASIFYSVMWFVIPLVIVQSESNWVLSFGLSIFDVSIIIFGSLIGMLADRWSKRRMIFYGLLLFSASGSLIGFNLNIWFIVLGFLATTGDEMSSISLWAWLNELDTTHDEDGLLTSSIVLFEDLGWALGPAFAGIVFVLAGPAWTLVAASVPIFILWLISTITISRTSHVALKTATVKRVHRVRHKR